MAPIVANTIKEWRLACPKGDANSLDLVFPSPGQIVGKGDNRRTEGAGRPLSHACILKDGFCPLQVAAGIVRQVDGKDAEGKPCKVDRAKFGLHALRHAAAALFIEQEMSPKRVQTLMGHTSIKMTYDLLWLPVPQRRRGPRGDGADRSAADRLIAVSCNAI